jgi:nucleotide-binding universal stress UspA family protein
MSKIKKIMVAVDLSDYSLASVEYAHDLARALGAEIMLVCVFNQRDVRTMQNALDAYDAGLCEKLIEENLEYRRNALENLTLEAGAQKTVTRKIVRLGVPYLELLNAIEQEKPDLLVMGTKGRSNLADTIVGSCAQKMNRRSPIPVLSLRPASIRSSAQ